MNDRQYKKTHKQISFDLDKLSEILTGDPESNSARLLFHLCGFILGWKMESYAANQQNRRENSPDSGLTSKIREQRASTVTDSFRESLRYDFFGTKQDRQKSFFVFSMLILIAGFFVLSAFNISLDVIVGAILVCYGMYGGIYWTKEFLNDVP